MFLGEWKQVGATHLWRYDPEKPGLRGWHLTGDKPALQSISSLLGLMQGRPRLTSRALGLDAASTRSIKGPVTPVGDRRVTVASSLELVFDPERPADFWQLSKAGTVVTLQLGAVSLVDLREGFESLIASGTGDFSVGPRDARPGQNIWFW